MIEQLVKLASMFEAAGLTDYAAKVEEIIEKIANEKFDE